MKPICGQNDLTRFAPEITGAIGTIDIAHPAGTFAPSPASVIAVQAIATIGACSTGPASTGVAARAA